MEKGNVTITSSSRGVDRPYIRGVQDATVARKEIDLHLRISIPSTPVWEGGESGGPGGRERAEGMIDTAHIWGVEVWR